MHYKKLTGIILKKQNFREADQIITIWTRELGKVRFLARGIRLPKSKLVYHLHDLSLTAIEVTGRGSLPTLISAQTVQAFSSLKTDLPKLSSGLYCAELVLKMTADEHPNEPAFDLMVDLFEKLEKSTSPAHYLFVDGFALNLAQALGFGSPKKSESHGDVRNFIESLIERQMKSEPFYQLTTIN